MDARELRHWPVAAWIRLKVPQAPAPVLLMGGPPPPPRPPLDILEVEAVATDPSVQLYTFHEPLGEGGIRYTWQGSNPEILVAEYHLPRLVARLPSLEVRAFWAAVKSRLNGLGPVVVEAADPRG